MTRERIAIESLSVFGMPPVEFVHLAADLGCRYISSNFTPPRVNPHNYPPWSLREDPALRRDLIAAMRARGVSISLGDGFGIIPNSDVRNCVADLELMRGLEVRCINAVCVDHDLNRGFDQLAILAEMTDLLGMTIVLEFAPTSPIPDLPTALAAVRHVGRTNFQLLIDAMHLIRSGSTPADVAALEPSAIGYMQLCDVPLQPTQSDYIREARYERLPPGAGELPLLDLLAAIPRDVIVGLEVPQRSLAEAGMGPKERLGMCVRAASDLLARATAMHEGLESIHSAIPKAGRIGEPAKRS